MVHGVRSVGKYLQSAVVERNEDRLEEMSIETYFCDFIALTIISSELVTHLFDQSPRLIRHGLSSFKNTVPIYPILWAKVGAFEVRILRKLKIEENKKIKGILFV